MASHSSDLDQHFDDMFAGVRLPLPARHVFHHPLDRFMYRVRLSEVFHQLLRVLL